MTITLKEAIESEYFSDYRSLGQERISQDRDLEKKPVPYDIVFSRNLRGSIEFTYAPYFSERPFGCSPVAGKWVEDPNFFVDLSNYFSLIYKQEAAKNSASKMKLTPVSKIVYDDFLKKYSFHDTTLIDFGCGSGEKGIYFYEQLKSIKKTLVFTDFSEELLNIALDKAKKKGINPWCIKADLEKLANEGSNMESPFKLFNNIRLFLLLGRTIENFKSPGGIISNLSSIMNPNDLLLVEGSLYKEEIYAKFERELKNHPFCRELGDSIETKAEVCTEGGDPEEDGLGNKESDRDLVVALATLKEDRPDYKLKKGYSLVLGFSWSQGPKSMESFNHIGLNTLEIFKRVDKRCRQKNSYLAVLRKENI